MAHEIHQMRIAIAKLFLTLLACLPLCAASSPASDAMFYKALRIADSTTVLKALKQGASPRLPLPFPDRPEYSKTPLGWLLDQDDSSEETEVVDMRRLEVAKILFSRGATLSGRPDELFAAITRGHARLLEFLLSKGAETDGKIYGYSPLQLAYLKEQRNVYEILLKSGAKSLPEAQRQQLNLTRYSAIGDVDGIERSLLAGADINGLDPSGETALSALLRVPLITNSEQLTSHNMKTVVLMLGTWNANPAKKSETEEPVVPIIQWIRMNSFVENGLQTSADVLEIFLKYGARVDEVDDLKQTALHVAAKSGNIPACAVLLRYKAMKSARDYAGRTPLDVAKNAATRAFLRAN